MNSLELSDTLLHTPFGTDNSALLALFQHQVVHNPVYKLYCEKLHINPSSVQAVNQIPFLPIRFFKTQLVKTGSWKEEKIFNSSGTTTQVSSAHYVDSEARYHLNALQIFTTFFQPLTAYHLVALLPTPQERPHSSLVSMVHFFIQKTNSPLSGFYSPEDEKTKQHLARALDSKRSVLLWGVPYALLDFEVEKNGNTKNLLVMETGGMKGKRAEMLRQDLHDVLKKKFNVAKIYSEYGMSELFSQAYTKGDDVFYLPDTMRVLIRDLRDPFQLMKKGKAGGINIIDLANKHSCSFIETEDVGIQLSDNSFQLIGRTDSADVRGCNLLYVN